jgi:pilus assembly protein Flp/PilA
VRIFQKLTSDERGGTLIEYALICGLIVIAILGGLNLFATRAVNMLNNVATQVGQAG